MLNLVPLTSILPWLKSKTVAAVSKKTGWAVLFFIVLVSALVIRWGRKQPPKPTLEIVAPPVNDVAATPTNDAVLTVLEDTRAIETNVEEVRGTLTRLPPRIVVSPSKPQTPESQERARVQIESIHQLYGALNRGTDE